MKRIEKITKLEGKVTISELYKGEVLSTRAVTNNGTQHLFSGMLRFLRGDFIANSGLTLNYLPRYLGVGKSDSSDWTASSTALEDEITPSFRWDVTPTQINYDDDTASLTFVSNIPSNSFSAGTEIKEMGMFYNRGADSQSLLNRIILSGEDKIVVQSDISYRVEWVFTLMNS